MAGVHTYQEKASFLLQPHSDLDGLIVGIASLSSNPLIPGILDISVREHPLRVEIEFDAAKTDGTAIGRWLVRGGVPVVDSSSVSVDSNLSHS